MAKRDFEAALARVVSACVPGFVDLASADRLTGGASQETWRLTLETTEGKKLLCLRRSVGAVEAGSVTPATEAALFDAAGEAGIPVPGVKYVLAPGDGLC